MTSGTDQLDPRVRDGAPSTSGSPRRSHRPVGPALLAWFVAYVAVDAVVALAQPEGTAAPWYPPLAIGIALLAVRGVAAWPVIVAADLVVAVSLGTLGVAAAGADALVVAGQAVLFVALAGRALARRRQSRPADAVTLLGAAAASAALGATVGAPVLSWLELGAVDWSEWRTWFLGDLTGIVTVLPAIVLTIDWWRGRGERSAAHRWDASPVEAALVAGIALVGTVAVFVELGGDARHHHGFELLLVVPVVWLAARTAPAPTALLALAINLAAVSVLVVRAPELFDISEQLVSLQGFMLALSATGLVTSVAVSSQRAADEHRRTLLDASPLATVSLDRDGHVSDWNPAAEATFGWRADEVIGRPFPLIDPDDWEAFAHRHADLLAGRGADGVRIAYRHRDGHRVAGRLFATRLLDGSGHPVGAIGLIEDLGDHHQLLQERDRLAAAIEQAAESIVVTDPSARIVYANPAVERATGYTIDELLGQNPRIFQSGRQSPELYAQMWDTLTSGRPWRGVLVNRRKDGSLIEEDATISPVRDEHGELVAYVGVKRDLTVEQELRDQLAAEVQDRASTVAALARVRGDGTLEDIAHQVTAEVSRLEGAAGAAVLWLNTDGSVWHRSLSLSEGLPVVPELLPTGEAELIRTRAASLPGGWAESREEHGAVCRSGCVVPPAAPVTGLVHVPVHVAGDPVAVIAAFTTVPDGGEWARRRLPAVAEFATHTAALITPLIDHHTRVEEIRARIRQVIDEAAFTPVFQSIVDGGASRTVGHEALTRFADGTRPDLRFLEAAQVGLGDELEEVCARAAAAVAADLPGTGFVSVNLSPSMLRRELLLDLQLLAHRPIVVELTEHVAVEDYETVRSTIDPLRPRVRLAVDDAGSGYASLRHVLELRPDFVKLDLFLVRDVHRDPARQAIVAGMVHYAAVTGTLVIAEGVETREEAHELERLGVTLMQGYLWSHPAPLRPSGETPAGAGPTAAGPPAPADRP